MDIDAAREVLYGGPAEDFVGRRRELARQARVEKDRALAQRIEALRKPSRSAWLVNQLARDPQADLAELFSLAPLLATMHTSGSPEQLRELTILRRRTVAALVERAVALGRSAGHPATEQTRREVETCLEAALAHPDAAAQVLQGCLVRTPETAAAFPLDLFEAPAVAPTPERPQPAAPQPQPDLAPVIELPRDDEQRERLRAERERARAEQERRRAEQEAERARVRAMAARLQELENRLAAVADAVRAAADEERAVDEQERAATEEAGRAVEARERAAERLEEARRELAEATAHAEEASAMAAQAATRRDEARRRSHDLAREQADLQAEADALRGGVTGSV